MPRTALHDAKSVEEVREALRAGVDVDALDDENGKTALMFAAKHGGEHGAGMMRLLLDAGADANTQDTGGRTAIQYAAVCCADAMRLLVARGAALPLSEELLDDTPATHAEYVCGAQNWTPLHRAADARDFAALFTLLRERTPLHLSLIHI